MNFRMFTVDNQDILHSFMIDNNKMFNNHILIIRDFHN